MLVYIHFLKQLGTSEGQSIVLLEHQENLKDLFTAQHAVATFSSMWHAASSPFPWEHRRHTARALKYGTTKRNQKTSQSE